MVKRIPSVRRWLLAAAALSALPSAAGALPASVPGGAAYGEYAVGVATGFAVDNLARFDPWNSVYGDEGYRAFLRRVDASGQPRTIVFQLWYPARAREGEQDDAPRKPVPAGSGRRAFHNDFFFQDPAIAEWLGRTQVWTPEFLHLRGGGTLATVAEAERQERIVAIGRHVLAMPQGAWQDATAAKGKFPLIILSHGLAGNHSMWRSFGEFLASRGYIVAAPTFISDGSLPLVFHDENSAFANHESPAVVAAAYETLAQFKVVPYFHGLLFGAPKASQAFDSAKARVPQGGVERATTMMRNLFRQRVADVALVLRTVRHLGADPANCRASLAAMGATSAAQPVSNRYLCQLLNGRVDGDRVGVAGHSLGSMTAQLAANHIPGVAAALGLNNAPPLKWTPEEMLGGWTPGGAAAGSRKPLLLMIGDEDAFVQSIFIGLFTNAVRQAGGDPALAFPLPAERAVPERQENPQPVALSAYERALATRMLVIVRDTNHAILAEDMGRLFPWPALARGDVPFAGDPRQTRKPTGEAAFQPNPAKGEAFDLLDWETLRDGTEVYLPHLIRDWYAAAWFDWHLKGDESARARLVGEAPFGGLTHVRKDLR